MLCKVDGCDKIIPGVQGDGFYDKKEYIGLCPAHKMALRRYGDVYGKQPIRQACQWCDNIFENKRIAAYCSKVCRSKGLSQQRTASGKNREQVRKYLRTHPAKAREIWRRYATKARRNSPDKFKARAMAQKQIPLQPCVVCGTIDNIERHHPDYSKPLGVVFLCRTHHKEAHPKSAIC